MLVLGPLLVSLTSTAAPELTSAAEMGLSARVALGSEWDTNARRAVSPLGQSNGEGDALARLVLDLRSGLSVFDQRLDLGYVLGAKRFFQLGTEDLLVHDLSAHTGHPLTSFLSAGAFASLRASRMRSGARDYTLGLAGAALSIHPPGIIGGALTGRWTTFAFRPDEHLSYGGPSVGAEVNVRPLEGLSFSGSFERTFRSYRGNALVLARVSSGEETVDVLTYCDGSRDPLLPPDCTPREREDDENAIALRVIYRGRVRISGEYLLRIQRSTSDYENVDRHRVFVHAAFTLPLEVTANLSASLQLTNGVSITDTRFLAEDDENQNAVNAQLARRLSESLSAEVRYAFFANQFSTADVGFFRQIIYLGLSYRTRE